MVWNLGLTASTPLPGFCRWQHILRKTTSLEYHLRPPNDIEISLNTPPAVGRVASWGVGLRPEGLSLVVLGQDVHHQGGTLIIMAHQGWLEAELCVAVRNPQCLTIQESLGGNSGFEGLGFGVTG